MKEKLKSRKLWMTIGLTFLGILYPPALPLVKIALPSYVGAQGVVDALEMLKKR